MEGLKGKTEIPDSGLSRGVWDPLSQAGSVGPSACFALSLWFLPTMGQVYTHSTIRCVHNGDVFMFVLSLMSLSIRLPSVLSNIASLELPHSINGSNESN